MLIHHLAEVMPPKDPDVNNNAYHMHKQCRNYGLHYRLHACELDTMGARIERGYTVKIMIILILSPALWENWVRPDVYLKPIPPVA